MYAGIAIGRSRSQTNNFFPGNRHIAVSQAVDTPSTNAPIPTPEVNSKEFNMYSDNTESLRCSQFSPEGSINEDKIVRIGMLKIKAVTMILVLQRRLIKFFISGLIIFNLGLN